MKKILTNGHIVNINSGHPTAASIWGNNKYGERIMAAGTRIVIDSRENGGRLPLLFLKLNPAMSPQRLTIDSPRARLENAGDDAPRGAIRISHSRNGHRWWREVGPLLGKQLFGLSNRPGQAQFSLKFLS